MTDVHIARGTVVWEADTEQAISKVLTLEQVLALPPSYRDAWLEYAWHLSNEYVVGPRLDLPLEDAKMLDASNFLNHSSNPALGFSGDFNLVALRDIHPVRSSLRGWRVADPKAGRDDYLRLRHERVACVWGVRV